MAVRRIRFSLIVLAGAALTGWFAVQRLSPPPALFPELAGPLEPTSIPTGGAGLTVEDFRKGGRNALALVVRNEDSSWLGLAIGLKSIGVPFRIVPSIDAALGHDVIMIYPSLTGSNTDPGSLRALAAHVRNGGTLLAFSVIGGGMPDLFGFEASREIPLFQELRFTPLPFNQSFAGSEVESRIRLGPANMPDSGLPGTGYFNPRHPPLATFEDGSAAITHNFFASANGTGHAYALGLDLGHFILRSINGRFTGLADTYVNAYQPKIDTLLRFIANVYSQGEEHPILLSPTPMAKDLTVLVTHDIDFTASIDNALTYAEYENSVGVPATYFIQTKYVTDYNDDYFFDRSRIPVLRRLAELGMEIASHTVAHSNEFRYMPAGTGTEQYPAYRPFVQNFGFVRNASIAGELRVSKFLLEQTSGQEVVSFRPGHLSLPQSLPQMLEATGYRYSSSITANTALTHLPYREMYDRGYGHTVDIFQFPVTIEDEQGTLGERVDEAIAVARNIAAYRGMVNLLVHTDVTDHKLEFIRQFVREFREDAWFGTLREYGRWWAARDTVSLEVHQDSPTTRRVLLSSDVPVDGLTLELPPGWTYRQGLPETSQRGRLLSLGPVDASASLEFEVARLLE